MRKSWLAGWGAAKSYWKDKAFLVRPAPKVHIHMHMGLHRNTHAHTSTCVGIAVFVRNLHRLSFLFRFIWMLFAMNNLGRINFELLSFWKLTRFTLTHAYVWCMWTTHLQAYKIIFMWFKIPSQCLFHLLIYAVLNHLQTFRSSSPLGVCPHAGVTMCVCVYVNKQTQTGRCSPAGISQVLFRCACRLNARIRSSACVGVVMQVCSS